MDTKQLRNWTHKTNPELAAALNSLFASYDRLIKDNKQLLDMLHILQSKLAEAEAGNNDGAAELTRLHDENEALKEENKALKTAQTHSKSLETQLASSTAHSRPGFLDRIRKVFKSQPSPGELPNEKTARKAARERAFGNDKSNSGTPIWDRVKRFRKPPTDNQKLRAEYRRVRKTKGVRHWDSVKLTPK